MLKIKDNISPQKLKKKLLKLGFIESWNYIGMIKLEASSNVLTSNISIKDRNIKINIYLVFDEEREQKQNDFIADTLFDLIKAGLVEKV